MAHHLVPSDRIEGVPVYGPAGERIGTIERLMVEKISGNVAYAVLRCGGLLSPPPHHYSVPWSALRYDPAGKAYRIDMSLEDLRERPCDLDGEAFDRGDRAPPYHPPRYWTE